MTLELAIIAANPSMPRVDRVVENDDRVVVLAGTPTNGATLSNLLGAPALPDGYESRGFVLIPPSSGVTSTVRLTDAGLESELPTCADLYTPGLNDAVAKIEADIQATRES